MSRRFPVSFSAVLLLCSLTMVLAVGCRQAVEPAPDDVSTEKQPQPAKEVEEVDLASLCYNTGEDTVAWPAYDLPLEHTFDVPEVPPEIVGPFSAEDIPSEDD